VCRCGAALDVPHRVEKALQLLVRFRYKFGQSFTELQTDGAYGLRRGERIKDAGAGTNNAHDKDGASKSRDVLRPKHFILLLPL